MPKLTFTGQSEKLEKPGFAAHVRGGDEVIKPIASASLFTSRSGQDVVKLDVDDAHCVELELSGGVRLWTNADRLEQDFGLTTARDGKDDRVVIPTVLPIGRRSRGDADIVITGLKAFHVYIPGKIGKYIADYVEHDMPPHGDVFACSTTSAVGLTRATKLTGRGPILVFIHGTASSTEGSFGGLWEAVGANRILRLANPGARINELFERYGGRVLALQHRSLSESPVVNALALANRLAEIGDDEAELHLVSHSRGGMIGELLARGMRRNAAPFDEVDLALFADRSDRQLLTELGTVLQNKRFRITRFVRVACPAAGTTLADGRLDRYFSVLVNIAGKIPGLAANPAYDMLASVLAAVLKERTDPETLPGLEAMMPTSPLARMLNRRDVVTDADLHVLGGDLAMSGFWSTLKALATDFYFREDHDLVVHTRSMLGGAQRSGGIQYWIDTGGEVTHFNYFRRADTAARLRDALFGEQSLDDFHALKVKPSEVRAEDYRKRAAEALPVVFFIPEYFGNHLAAAGRVWANGERLASGGFGALARDEGVLPDDLVATYADLIRHLSPTHEVVPFAFDWRRSFTASADALREKIDDKLNKTHETRQPIRIIAHGAAGLIVRWMIGSQKGRVTWENVCNRSDARVLLLGMPTHGSHAVAAMLTGRSALTQGLATIDLTRDETGILRILAGFDGLLELLPDDGPGDCFAREWWSARKPDDRPSDKKLSDARKRRQQLEAMPLDDTHFVYVAGAAEVTPSAVVVSDAVELHGTVYGDGRVTWASGIPDPLKKSTYYMDAPHGALASTPAFFAALSELLFTGQTSKLPKKPPLRSSAPGDALAMPRRPLAFIPTDDELVGFALGYDVREDTTSKHTVHVAVVHENLSRAKQPVLVGHYQEDVFVNAEAYLNQQLDGRLRELHRLEVYPGPIGTAAVVSNTFDNASPGVHPGAIVVGLGAAGELTPGKLLATIEHGLIQYGLERVGQARRRRESSATVPTSDGYEVPASITALLVGSGQGGVPLAAALRALLRAVKSANERFAAGAGDEDAPGGARARRAVIKEVEIFELYEDRAIETVHVLNQLGGTAEFSDWFHIEPCLQSGSEGRQRASFEEPAGWWQRVRITEVERTGMKNGGQRVLKFEPLTERAGFASYTSEGGRQFADGLIAQAMASTAMDPAIGHTLFHALVPLEMKEGSADRRSLVLLLDEDAATIPWELLHNQFDSRSRPLAVEGGIIRQLDVGREGRARVNRASKPTALIIGDPPVTDPRFPALPGAAQEAEAVRDLLDGPFEVFPFVQKQATPEAVGAALHRRAWQVLHIASHGVFQFRATKESPPVTGIVLGDGVFLQPGDINQLWYVPDLVFLNCCHLGNVRGDAPREQVPYVHLAANIATQFIRMGVRAVVAAGWAVDDRAASAFAKSFYGQMLEGAQFGDAVQAARDAIFRQFPSGNTWGAYQCYGDPAFALSVARPLSPVSRLVAPRELSIALDSITARARAADPAAFDSLFKDLTNLIESANRAWFDDAAVCGSLVAAYGELRRFEDASRYYDKVFMAEKATASVKTLEQMANFKVRYAEIIGHEEPDRAEQLLADAERVLDGLIKAVGATSERWSLVGGLFKRRAMLVDGTNAAARRARKNHLAQMINGYGRAHDIKRNGRQRDPWYPLTNLVAGEIARSWQLPAPGGKAQEARRLKGQIDQHLATLNGDAQPMEGATDFWSLAFLADAKLMTFLAQRVLTSVQRAELLTAYGNARRRGASAKDMDSVTAQVRFLQLMARASPDKALDAVAQQLTTLQAEIGRR